MTIYNEWIDIKGSKNDHLLEVYYEVFPSEPDVGLFGNGKVYFEIVQTNLLTKSGARQIDLTWELADQINEVLYERLN